MNGNPLSWKEFRQIQENGHGGDGDNDLLVEPDTLIVHREQPLYPVDGVPALDRPAGPAALSLAWPTSDGYSTLILDLPGPGSYVFNLLAARSAVAELETQLAARPGYAPGPAFRTARGSARDELALAESAPTPSLRAVHGTRAYEAAVHAQLLLLKEFGTQYAAAHRGAVRPVWGVTFDSTAGVAAGIASARAMLHGRAGDGWVRIVFDREQPASSYRDVVAQVRAAGLHVVGQFVDSSDLARVGQAAWERRVAEYVTTLPLVQEWEVGNEVNGSWLGGAVTDKVRYAAAYVKAHTDARTLLTLYWQLGEDDAAHSVFTWVDRRLDPDLLRSVDDVGLSVYPGEHPLGAAFDRVFRTLHRRLPAQHLLVSELGYGSPDLDRTWWWGSPSDVDAGQAAVADLYSRAALGYPYSRGGPYWWYFLTEGAPGSPVWSAIASAHAAVIGADGRR